MKVYKYTFELEDDNKVVIESSSRMDIKGTLTTDWYLGEKKDGCGSTAINMNKVIALYEEIINN